ncbi:MAG TPA: protein kinase [Streptosporangiaceae bacterium]
MQTDALRPGDPKRLGSYDLVGRLGDGGQGVVFHGRAEDGTDVAIKLLHRELTGDDMARIRFLREIEFAKQVASFCTAQIIDADIEGERPYLVSEYVPGPSVLQLVHAEGPISGGALDRLAIGTATALVAIHQAGVIHRDFKPANVLIGPGGPRVIDFGIARLFDGDNTMTSRVVGTPAFMSPEQMRGQDFGKEADIFCWAATMVYAATGRPPFGNDSIPAVIQRTLGEEPDLGDVGEPLRGLLAECLAKEPAARPAARQLLMRLLGQEDAAPAPSGAPVPAEGGDPAAILVKIAEATARPDVPAGPDTAADRRPARSDPRFAGAGFADAGFADAGSTAPPGYTGWEAGAPAPSAEAAEPPVRHGRARGVALTTAAIVAVAATVGGTAYVLAQSPPPNIRHVNNPTSAPNSTDISDASEPPPAAPIPTVPAPRRRTPTAVPTVQRTPAGLPSPTAGSPRSTRPAPTPSKTRTATPTPTPTPTEPDPSSSPGT